MRQSMFHRPVGLVRMLAFAGLLLAGCAVATGVAQMPDAPATAIELPGDGPFQRFIVHYRADSNPGRDPAQVQVRLQRTAADAGLVPDPVLSWQRRLAVGADLFLVDRPLDRAEATRLMQAFADDPQVESIEVDRRLGIDPPATMRMRDR